MSRVFLHLGYPKTGTSTLQSCVFDVLHQASMIRYLGMGGFNRDNTSDRKEFFRDLTNALYIENDNAFSEKLPALRAAYKALVIDVPSHMPIVLSNEHFLLSNWSSRERNTRVFPSRSAARLAKVFEQENVDLIIGTRDLADLVRSMYVQRRSKKTHTNQDRIPRTLAEFLESTCSNKDFTSQMFHIDKNRALYCTAFPEARMMEIPFKELTQTKQRETVENLLIFLGLPKLAVSKITFPLENRNPKEKNNRGSVVETVPTILRPLAQNKSLSALIHIMKRSEPINRLLHTFLIPDEIPHLTIEQRQAIEEAFSTNAEEDGALAIPENTEVQ